MIQMLRKRLDKKEEGFTLIELMVVVLIIAILLAIAIPTFLGARSRAQNRSAQSNLRNALTAEKTAYTDAQTYSSDTAALASIEPSLTWVAGASAPAAGSTVEVATADSGATVCMGATSSSGSSFWLMDTGSGTYYGKSTNSPTCLKADNIAAEGWYTTTSGAGW